MHCDTFWQALLHMQHIYVYRICRDTPFEAPVLRARSYSKRPFLQPESRLVPTSLNMLSLLKEAVKLTLSKLFFHTRPYISQCTLGCPHMAVSWPPAQFTREFHFCSSSQKALRHRRRCSCPPRGWHLQRALIWRWFTAHVLKIYIEPDAAVELYINNDWDINNEICLAEWVKRSNSLRDCGKMCNFCSLFFV